MSAPMPFYDLRRRRHLLRIAAEDLNRNRAFLFRVLGVLQRPIDATNEPLRADHLGDDQPASALPLHETAEGSVRHSRHRRESERGTQFDRSDFHIVRGVAVP